MLCFLFRIWVSHDKMISITFKTNDNAFQNSCMIWAFLAKIKPVRSWMYVQKYSFWLMSKYSSRYALAVDAYCMSNRMMTNMNNVATCSVTNFRWNEQEQQHMVLQVRNNKCCFSRMKSLLQFCYIQMGISFHILTYFLYLIVVIKLYSYSWLILW